MIEEKKIGPKKKFGLRVASAGRSMRYSISNKSPFPPPARAYMNGAGFVLLTEKPANC